MTKKLISFLVSFGMITLSCQQEAATPVAEEKPSVEVAPPAGSLPGILRVKFKQEPISLQADGFTLTRTFPPAGKWEARHRAAGLHLWYDVVYDASSIPVTKAGELASALENVDIVEFIPEACTRTEKYPFDDPRLPSQWHYQNFGDGAQMAEGCDVNAFKAWTIETGKPEVIVAVNDIGVDFTHEDLAANLWINEAEVNGRPGEDDDNNGYVDDFHGFSFMTTDGKIPVGKIEPGDHGTHVAGTIAAVNNNGIGVSGVAGGNGTPESGARIMITQTLDGRNGALVPASFVYAADNGAVLINCSWGFTNNEQPTPKSYVEAIDYFNAYAGLDENGEQIGPMAGGLVIFAAGNDGREIEHPAMDENVFAVAALSANYVRSYFTSYGEWVDICAPGGDANRGTFILSTLPDNKYGNMQGSSMAAPHVTGVAALLVSYYGAGKKGFTREKLIHLMQSTANKRALEENGSYATRLGAGLVDAYAALTAGEDQTPLPVTDLSAKAQANTVTLQWSVPGSESVNPPYRFVISCTPGSQTAEVLTYGRKVGEIMSYTFTSLSFDTDYQFSIRSESLTGLVSETSKEVTVRTGHNNPPRIIPLDGTSLTLRSFESGQMRFKAEDADAHSLTFTLSESLPGLTDSFQNNLLTLSIDALMAKPGTYSGTFRISDGYADVSQDFQYTILPNTKPVIGKTFEDQVFNGTSENRQFTLSDYFSDSDGEPLSYQVRSSSTSIIVQADIQDGVLSLKAHSFGMTELTITASDASDASCSQTFRVLVRNGSSPLEVFPNPVKDNLFIRTSQTTEASVRMVSALGATVYEGQIHSNPFDPATIVCKDFPAGIYTLLVDIGEEQYKKTVVKQ